MFPNTTAPMAPDHYTLSLHDALPISARSGADAGSTGTRVECSRDPRTALGEEHQRAGNQCRLCRARFFHRLPYRDRNALTHVWGDGVTHCRTDVHAGRIGGRHFALACGLCLDLVWQFEIWAAGSFGRVLRAADNVRTAFRASKSFRHGGLTFARVFSSLRRFLPKSRVGAEL